MADEQVVLSQEFLLYSVVLLFQTANDTLWSMLTLCYIAQCDFRRRRAQFVAERESIRRHYLRRRRAFIKSGICAIVGFARLSNRRMWSRDRSHGDAFWATVESFPDEQWMAHFRMSRGTFQYLLDLLTPALTRQKTNFRKPIAPNRRLAIVLWWYATPGEYRTISCLFGVGISTVCTLVHEVTQALLDALYHRFISLPQGQRLDDTIAGFLRRGYPQCAGAIDGTHIPIIAPTDNPADYHNRKGWHSIILQAVVDHNYCFTDVFIGWPGRSHDARVLANSELYKIAENAKGGWLFPREKSTSIAGVEIPVHIIGDAAYPLRRWLMKGYTQHHQLSPQQIRFTHTLSSARMVVENAFGRLKGRWRCLLKRNDIDIKLVPHVVAACCILHNVCEIQKEQFLPEWNVVDSEVFDPPVESTPFPGVHPTTRHAEQIRTTITANLNVLTG